MTFLFPFVFFVVVSKSLLRSRKNNSYFKLKFCSDAEARMLIRFENKLDEIAEEKAEYEELEEKWEKGGGKNVEMKEWGD